MTEIAYDLSRPVQDDTNYFQWQQSTTGHWRTCDYTPECVNARWKPRDLRDQMVHKGHHRHWRWLSRVQVFLQVNWARSPSQAPILDGVTLPVNAAISKTKGEVERRFTSQYSYDFISSNWVKCTYLSLRVHTWLEQQQRSISPFDALLWPQRSAQAMCTYGDDTLRLKDIEDEKLSLDWSELIVAIHWAACSAFMVNDRHNSAEWLQWLQWLCWPQSTRIMHNWHGNRQMKDQRSFVTQQLNNCWQCRHSWRLWTKIKWRDATHMGSDQLWPNQHLYIQTPRLLKRLGLSHQVAHIITLAMTWGVMQHAMDSRKTRITVRYLDYLALVDKSDVLVILMGAYNLVLGLPWFPKQNPDIDWARLTPCDHLVRVKRMHDTDDYGSGIEGLTSW